MIKEYICFYSIVDDKGTIGDELRRFESHRRAWEYNRSLDRHGVKFATEFQTVKITRNGAELLESLFTDLLPYKENR